jgi:hypothetical protein
MHKFKFVREKLFFFSILAVVIFISNHTFAANIIDVTKGGKIAQDANIKDGVDFINWAIILVGGIGATIFTYSGMGNLKDGHYGPALRSIGAAFGCGICTYIVTTYIIK